MSEGESHPDPKLRWQHRRRMAYISLYSILIVTILILFVVPDEKLKVLDQLIPWLFMVLGSIVGAYVGFATIEGKWHKD